MDRGALSDGKDGGALKDGWTNLENEEFRRKISPPQRFGAVWLKNLRPVVSWGRETVRQRVQVVCHCMVS